MNYIDTRKELDIILYKIRCRNWIKCNYNGTGKAGLLFESLLNKKQDRYILPDYKCFEIKTKYKFSNDGIKLFSCSFDNKPREINRFLSTVGYYNNGYFSFQYSINTKNGRYIKDGFIKVKIYNDSKTVKLLIFKNHKYITCFSWTFDELESRIINKLKYLMIVYYDVCSINNNIYIKYLYAKYYKLKSFNAFLKCIEKGYITISFNIKSDSNNIVDKGTGFIIDKDKIEELFMKI